jgi:hypothetical protein
MKLCRSKTCGDAVLYVLYGRANDILGAYDTPIIGNVKLISLLTITLGNLFQLNGGLTFIVGCVANKADLKQRRIIGPCSKSRESTRACARAKKQRGESPRSAQFQILVFLRSRSFFHAMNDIGSRSGKLVQQLRSRSAKLYLDPRPALITGHGWRVSCRR